MAQQSSADETHELLVTGVASEGEGVARLADGRVAFVRGALPGDRVLARVISAKARVVFAESERLITPSPSRVESICKLDRCDGCPFERFDYVAQQAAKADTVLQAFARIARIDAAAQFRGLVASDPAWHYRHRVRMHARYDDQWRLGYFERNSHTLVPVETCPVLWPELDQAVQTFARWLADKPRSWGVREIEMAYSRRDAAASVDVQADGRADLSGAPITQRRLRYDQSRPFDMWFEAGVFTQANVAMNAKLVDAVLAASHGAKRLLELHAGIGNFSLPLAAAGVSVRAVELNARSSELAAENARGAGLAIETLALADAKAVSDADTFDTVLMDPPRAGAREASAAMATRGPKRIVYVSCDAATLARDVQILCGSGYHLTSLQAFDMFPQTPHVESLAVLER